MPGLGRKYAPDPRDRSYPVRALLRRVEPLTFRNWWAQGAWLDQGNTPHCVGYALTHLMEDGPVTHKGLPDPIVDPDELYAEAQEYDEWPGQNYNGTSARGGMKALQLRGLVSEYRWAFTVEDIIDTLLNVGPVAFGSNWYEGGMFEPQPKPGGGYRLFLEPSGRVAGGHEYVLDGVNIITEWARVKNSWGRGWGYNGFAWMTFEVLERLLTEDGDAVIATEARTNA